MIETYLNLVPSENKDKPKFIEWLSSTIQIFDDVKNLSDLMHNHFNLDDSEGEQLDIIGEWVNVSRNLNFQPVHGPAVLDDDFYRRAISIQISRNSWDGTNEEYLRLWNLALPDTRIIFTDNQDMTITVLSLGTVDDYTRELIVNGYFDLKPQGVGFQFSSVPILFAYDSESLDPNEFSGYDEGFYL